MKVLVTGVTGYLGGRIAEHLVRAGHALRGFVRDASRWTDRPQGVDVALGDVVDPPSLARAVAGCDAIVHAAALVKLWCRDEREYDRVNVEGLAHVARVASEHGTRLLYLSSFVALGPTDGAVFDEDTPRAATAYHNAYERTKSEADRLARDLAARGAAIVRLYPGVVYGPGTLTQGNHVVGLLLQHAAGKLPGLLGAGDRRQCFAYVDDVASGVTAALDRAAAGSAYILGGENRTAIELFQAFEAATGIAPPRRHIPFGVAALIGRLQRWRARLVGIEPQVTDEVVGIYRHEWAYSSERARRELGYHVTPLEEGVSRTVAWLRATGRL